MLETSLFATIHSTSSIFDEKLVDEHARILASNNEPLWTFEYSDNNSYFFFFSSDDNDTYTTYTVEVYPPLVAFYNQVGLLILFQIGISCILGTIIYYVVVKQNHHHTTCNTTGLLLGYGIIIPISIYLPFYIIDIFDIRSKSLRLSLCCIPMTITMSTMEAMYGFTPTVARISLFDYLCNVAFVVRPKYKTVTIDVQDKKDDGRQQQSTNGTTSKSSSSSSSSSTARAEVLKKNYKRFFSSASTSTSSLQEQDQRQDQKELVPHHKVKLQQPNATWSMIGKSIQRYIFWFIITNIVFILLHPYNYEPFTTVPTGEGESDKVPLISFHPSQLYNTFLQAWISNLLLVFSMSGVCSVVMLLTGKQFHDTITYNPMFLSISPSDFWGNRWNTLIHTSLKQGIYKPVRFYFTNNNRSFAYLCAFVMSGIIHELVWKILFVQTTNEIYEFGINCEKTTTLTSFHTCYKATFGKQLIFFTWNGVLLVVEHTSYGQRFFSYMQQYLPRLVLGHIVVLMALPVGHLFTDDVTKSGSYHHTHHGFFLLNIINKK